MRLSANSLLVMPLLVQLRVFKYSLISYYSEATDIQLWLVNFQERIKVSKHIKKVEEVKEVEV